jgi:hypothetical protein
MIHRTFRSLDEQPRLVGFTFGQWLRLLALGALAVGLVVALALPLKAAISLCAFLIGMPAALSYVSEPGGVQWGRLLCDALGWWLKTRRLI